MIFVVKLMVGGEFNVDWIKRNVKKVVEKFLWLKFKIILRYMVGIKIF